jgi:hypothetical protein
MSSKKTLDSRASLKPNMPASSLPSGRRRKGSMAPIPVEIQEMATANFVSNNTAAANTPTRMYYGYNPKVLETLNNSGKQVPTAMSSTNVNVNSTNRSNDLRGGVALPLSHTSHHSQMNQGQGGFFTKEDNPYVLFNQPAASSSIR